MKRNVMTWIVSSICLIAVGDAVGDEYEDGYGNVSPVAPGEVMTADQTAVVEYWTDERQKAAVPPEVGLPGEPQSPGAKPAADFPADPGEEVPSTLNGDPTTVLIGDDLRPSLAVTGALFDEAALEALTDPEGADAYSYPPPSTTYAIPLSWYGSFPIRAVGKLYFTRSGLNYVCSGSVLNTPGGNYIQTAGHCVSSGNGTFATNFLFKPAHRPSWDAPFGSWTAQNVWVRTAWHLNGNWCEDLACIIANRDSLGRTIKQRVGGFGTRYNVSRIQHWSIFGYPATWGYSGSAMILSEASWNRNDRPATCASESPSAIGVGWGQAPGSSGGPWVVGYKPQQSGANNYVNGVNSYYYTSEPEQIYSPYFGSQWKSLYDTCLGDGA